MKFLKCSTQAIILAFTFTVSVAPAHAGLFDDPENLKVLPKDITAQQLGAIMRGFAINTGSRCFSCHVGEVEADLSTYDFSLDDKEKKHKARVMLQMVNDINENLAEKLDIPADELVKVDCATCHRGQVKPEMLQDVLTTTFRHDGLPKAVEQYRSLREEYYGSYTFDFSESVLISVAQTLGRSKETDGALGFVKLNLEFFPQSMRSYVLQAQIFQMNGDVSGARVSFNKALEIQPDAQWVKKMLAALDKMK